MSSSSSTADVVMYSTRYCPYCVGARQLLSALGVEFVDIAVDGKPELRQQVMQRSGQRTVPQIWIGDTHVGGYTELCALDSSGELDRLLNA